MIHGFDVEDSPPPPPATRAPHSWHYALPTGIGVWHDGHRGSLKAVPQLLQNFPVSRVPQLGHVVGVKKLSPAWCPSSAMYRGSFVTEETAASKALQARFTFHALFLAGYSPNTIDGPPKKTAGTRPAVGESEELVTT